MRFRVENLGPLREAEVDLGKRLIVLAGPNNTGKTYFSTAVYGLFRGLRFWTTEKLRQHADRILSKAEQRAVLTVGPADIGPLVNDVHQKRLSVLVQNLDACFGTAEGALGEARLDLLTNDDAVARAFLDLRQRKSGYGTMPGLGYVRRRVAPLGPIQVALVSDEYARGWKLSTAPVSDAEWDAVPAVDTGSLSQGAVVVVTTALADLYGELTVRGVRIFPAERLAINLFAREIAAARVELADDLLDEGKDAGRGPQRLAWPIRDAVQAALRLPDHAKVTSLFADLAADLENDILGGAIGVSQYGAATFTPHQTKAALDVQQSASVVKSLASIVFYFRHQARAGDFLLIDEPELNLHPDNQRKVARFLARAVNRGFRILISTHSDYVLRELNHLLMLGRPDERAKQLARDLGYPEDALLQPEDVGVYLFQDGTAKELPVSVEGFEVKTIEDEIAKLNEISQRIYATFLG